MEDTVASIEPPKKWLKLRKQTVVVFAIESLLIGMDSSLTFLTLWIYLKQLINPKNPELWYGLISSAYMAATLALSGFVGRIADKTRSVRRIFFILNSVTIIGNLLYAIPISPWLLVIARFLTGFCGPLRSVIIGEISRSHHPEYLTNVLSVVSVAFTLGYTVGPALNAVCKDIHFYVYKYQISFANFPGIYMAAFFLMAQFLCFFLLSDLSKIYDLRDEMTKGSLETIPLIVDHGGHNSDDSTNTEEDTDDQDFGTKGEEHFWKKSGSVVNILTRLFTELETILLLYLSFIDGYFETTFELWVPMVVIDTLGWSPTLLSVIALWGGLSCLVPCIVLAVVNLTNNVIYVIALFSVVSLGLMEGTFMVLKMLIFDNIIRYAMWGLYGLMYAFLIIMGEVFLVSSLANMVDPAIQTFVDSVRLSAYRLGSLIGLLTAPLLFRWIHIAGWVHLTLVLFAFVLMLTRRNFFMNPKIIIFGK